MLERTILISLMLIFPTLGPAEPLLTELVQKAQATDSDVLLVYQNGTKIYEDYFGNPEKLWSLQSITKSIVAIAVMILYQEGKIPDLDMSMANWIKSWQTDPVRKRITLRMVLTQTSGLSDDDRLFTQPDVLKFASELPVINSPGTEFLYSNAAVAMLERVISAAGQMSAEKFIERNLFKPLQIRHWHWDKDDKNHLMVAGGLYLAATDLVKFGEFLLNGGSFGRKSILEKRLINEMTARSTVEPSYGLLWWTYPNQSFSAYGFGGQHLTINPKSKIVAVRLRDPFKNTEKAQVNSEFLEFPESIANARLL